ncbi:hypothetical protein DLJ53_33365 [Acuticoccus sediminis]|uniref:DUF1330 domain-containing protein n=1 Tax=Acuticoccus sediminis TaxID=2184697 RepID=A0A8B2NF32_9HYPH|nr:hypothetical protein [Acuticoccus sediminis]RAH96115.1 hypothetical protein DLJ53_33365 [Acuticoccus sediminis]
MHSIELSPAALDAAEQAAGDGPVVMVNLLKFRDRPDYPQNFEGARSDSRTGYFEGYVGGFMAACGDVGVTPQPLYAGRQFGGIMVGEDDAWDDIAVVWYDRFADLRRVLASETYIRSAKPHRFAVLADWRFIATRSR